MDTLGESASSSTHQKSEQSSSYVNSHPQPMKKEVAADAEDDCIVYGELIVLGTNGHLPNGDKGRAKSRFILRRKKKSAGFKPSEHSHVLQQTSSSQEFKNNQHHSASYTFPESKTAAVVVRVPYICDFHTDVFQIGRSTEECIDFVVRDISPGASLPARHRGQQPQQSAISRFACRIVCDRNSPFTPRIYAAGYDTSMKLVLDDKAPKWMIEKGGGKRIVDGLTANGVLIMQPKNGFCESSEPTQWKEVSACGDIYQPRESRSVQAPGAKVEDASNILVNGTLINLCGVTLLWRSSNNANSMPSPRHIDELIQNFDLSRQYPVRLSSLAFPRRNLASKETEMQPWVYLECGHVHGRIEWGYRGEERRACPLCRSVGKYVPLWMGNEPAFYIDTGSPTHCFIPCGHVSTAKTAIYWSRTALPHGTQAYNATCPFCVTPLEGLGYIKLIWQQPVD